MNSEGGKAMSDESNGGEGRSRFGAIDVFRGYLDLTRLPNVFTAVADVTMGFLIARPPGDRWIPDHWDFGAWAMLAAASALLYAAGVVLNDVFDVEHDRDRRPERPLPSGRVSQAAARRFGWSLLWLGVALGAGGGVFVGHLRPGVVAALLAAAILLYNGRLKRTPLGPPTMGFCRMLNVMLGVNATDVPLEAGFWLVAAAIGVYVAGVTWFAQNESRRGKPLQLASATTVMALGISALALLPHLSDRVLLILRQTPQRWYLLLGVLGLLIVWRAVRTIIDPTPTKVRMAVAQCVLSIIMLDAVACYAFRDVYWAALILLLFVPAMLLRQWIEVT